TARPTAPSASSTVPAACLASTSSTAGESSATRASAARSWTRPSTASSRRPGPPLRRDFWHPRRGVVFPALGRGLLTCPSARPKVSRNLRSPSPGSGFEIKLSATSYPLVIDSSLLSEKPPFFLCIPTRRPRRFHRPYGRAAVGSLY